MVSRHSYRVIMRCNLLECECGCGELLISPNHVRDVRFKTGHYLNIKNPNGKGELSCNWKGGKYVIHGYRYVLMRDHPFATKQGCILEHRLVWEEHNNAILLPWADVHHINGIKTDNRIENLEAMMKHQHASLELRRRCNV